MNVAPCSGTGSQVTMTAFVKFRERQATHRSKEGLSCHHSTVTWTLILRCGGVPWGLCVWTERENGWWCLLVPNSNRLTADSSGSSSRYGSDLLCSLWTHGNFGCFGHSVCLFCVSAERSARPPAVTVMCGGCEGWRDPTEQHRRPVSAALHPPPQTTMALWAACSP